ncbi:MAG: hypothetical protein HDT30_11725 [Clostridiales bacterium]|nr:hypothetical protein [Clostridiales bacterium]
MNQLSIELEKNSESSLDIAHKTQETVHRMIETKDKMELLEFSISEIEATNKSVGIIANMACVPQFDTMHPSMSLDAFFNDRNFSRLA